MPSAVLLALAAVPFVLLLTPASSQDSSIPMPVEGFEETFRAGDVILSAQPDEETLRRLIESFKVVRVVNTAPARFMERNVDFDEAALLAELGVTYVPVPYAGSASATPDRTRQVGEAIAGANGPVLYHGPWVGDIADHWFAVQTLRGALDPVRSFEEIRAMTGDTMKLPFENFAGGRLSAVGLDSGGHPDLPANEPINLDVPLSEAPIGLGHEADYPEGVAGFIAVNGRFAYGGQPTEATLERLASEGCTLVYNIRRSDEMERVDFDEAAVCKRLGMEYIQTPTGWSTSEYTPEQLAHFASTLKSRTGKVFLHCQVGWRAQHYWAAYLHRYRGFSVQDALWIADAPVDSWPVSMYERLIGRDLRYELVQP